MLHFIIIIGVINGISPCVGTIESHGQAFIQTDNNELRYMVDGHIDGVPFNVIPENNIQTSSLNDGSLSATPIRFQPAILDFREQPVGIPHMEQVTVQNPDVHHSLHLLSISGSSQHFHCSFFQDKMVSPGGNTSFDVVFLARQLGNVENTLYIHTSQGSFKYQVLGVGVPNPYRVQPFLGAKLPINSSFSSLIHLHNPHSSTLQVVEMYSSAGDLHLELPTGEKEAPSNLWEIPPYETKSVMKASFYGREESNHTAFIRIRTNQEQHHDTLVVPVEVEVTSSPGIFSTQSEMYFGILRTSDSPKVLRLNLLNHGSEAIYITSVSLAEPNEAISIDFRPIKLHPDVLQATQVAVVSFTASKATDISQFHGTIYVKTKHGHPKLSVPYYANVLHGSLVYDTNRTQFYTGYKEIRNVSRDFVFTNTFNFTLVIYNVSLSSVALPHLTISEFSSPTLLEPQKSATVFSLDLAPQENLLHFTTELSLYTNASVFTVPIVLYNGRLKVIHHRPEIFKGQLDFGTLGIEEPRSMSFTLRNDNPIDIICREFGANMERTIVEFLGVEAGNGTLLTRVHNTSEIDTDPLILKPYHYAVFNLNLTAPDWEGTFAAEVIIVTQNENLYIPMTLRTAEGSLNSVPEKIILDKCFPSKLPYKELQIHSLFTSYMEVRKVTFQPNDTRFYYVPPKHKPVLLEPQQDNIIGRIYFDPRRECKEDCYLSLPTSVVAGHHWLVGATLDKEVTDTDQYLYTRFQQKWQEIGQQQLNTINVTVQLDTNSLRGFLFPAQAHLHWPTLTKKWKIRFPLTQIGNISYSEFIVENPSDARVLMQILPLPLYPNPQTIIDMLHQRLQNEFTEYIEIDDNDIFLLPDLEAHNASLENTVPALRRGIEASLGVKPHKNTIAMIVEGGTKVRVRVAFKPKDDLFRTSLILIRNNLTIIDAVIVQGQGGLGELRFSNRKHGSSQPLMFEMTEKHLKGCDKRKQSKNISPSFTVKRTFTARNTGQLPFWVNDFYINDARCQGYGFMVLDCEGFELAPNASKKVDIAVTPDFTMSRMRRTLSLHTSLGTALNYTLQVTIPPHMLSKCASALPRPTCEPVLYYMAVCITVFMILGVCVAAYFEADHIYTADILRRHSKSGTSSPAATNGRTFDLKAIGVAAGKTIVNDKSVNVQKVAPTSAVNAQNTANIASEINHKRSKNQSQHSSPTSTTPSPTSPTPPTPSRPTASSFSWLKRLGRIVFSAAANLFSESDRPTHPSREPERPASSSRVQPLPLQATGSAAKLSAGQDKPMSIVAPTRSTIHPTHTEDIPMKPKLKSKSARNRNHDTSSLDQRKSPPPSAAPTTPYVQEIAPRTGRGTADLDDFDDLPLLATPVSKLTKDSDMTDIYNIDDDVRSNASSTSSKHANKKSKSSKKAKSSSITRQEARRQREKRQQELLLEADKDETSSTTTESSNADIDEKCVSTRESTPDETHQLKRRSKSSSGATGAVSKKERATKTTSLQSTGDEDEFIVTSRKQKHIKIDTKSTTGGNILKPSTLELPYLCKIEASKSETPPKDPSDAKPKKGKSSKKKTGDLSDLALQTQQFIKTSVAAATSKAETASTTAAARRGSSYSSILSSGISSAPPIPTTNTPASNTTTGLTDRAPGSHNTAIPNYIPGNGALGVAKQMAALNLPNFGQMPPTTVPLEMAFSGPGTIGMKSSTQPSSSPQPVSPSGQLPWMMSPNLAAPGTISPNVMSTTEPPVNNALVNHFTAQGQHTYPAVGNEGPQFGGSSYAQDKENATIMQKLQMERRLRYAEYQQKVNAEEDWPGFNLPSQSSLWDDKMSSNNWSAAMSDVNLVPTTSRAQPGLGLWSSPPPQTSQPPPPPSTWNPIGSIWNPNTAPPPTAPMDAASGMVHGGNYPPAQPPTNLPPTQAPQQGSYPSFSLGNIWNPSVAPPQMTPSPPASGAEPVPPGGWGYPGMESPPGSNSNQNNNNE